MQLSIFTLLGAFSLPVAFAQQSGYTDHSVCYNYFLQKDGCVFSDGNQDRRCNAACKAPSGGTPPFTLQNGNNPNPPPGNVDTSSYNQQSTTDEQQQQPQPDETQSNPQIQKRSMHRHVLAKRYDNTEKVNAIAGGSGICKTYDTNEDHGVCLWTGTSYSGDNASTAGWLNGALSKNCGHKIYVQRAGCPESVLYVDVIDGCTFNTLDPAVGCFQIALTNKTFNALKPTPEELNNKAIMNITWDFDNINGCNPNDAPF